MTTTYCQAENGNDWDKMPGVGLEWWPSTSQELRWWAWFSVKGIHFCAQKQSFQFPWSCFGSSHLNHIWGQETSWLPMYALALSDPVLSFQSHASFCSYHQHVSISLEAVILVIGLCFQWQSWSGLVFNGLSLDIMEKEAPSPISFHCSSKMDILILHFRTIYA